MSAIITTKFRYKNSNSLISDLASTGDAVVSILQDNNLDNQLQTLDRLPLNAYYLAIGRSETWTTANDGSTEAVPKIAADTASAERDALSNIIAMKKISSGGISRAIPRYNWISGAEYSDYDDIDPELSTKQYYVITDELNVYKCIKAGSGFSIIKPIGTSTGIQEISSDGYQWKYMYTLTSVNVAKFLTSTFIPVQTLATDNDTMQWQVQQNAIPGGIHRIKMINGGSGYNTQKPTVTISGNGTGATVSAENIILGSNGSIVEILISNPGIGYDIASVSITGGSGTGATARAVISPKGGHGANAADELGAYYVMVDTELIGADGAGDFIVGNDFRQILLVANPNQIHEFDNTENNYKGNWVAEDEYALHDVVKYGGSMYTCITAHTASTTFSDDALNWKIAERAIATTLNALTIIEYTVVSGAVTKDLLLVQPNGATAYIDSVYTETVNGTTINKLKIHQNATTGFVAFVTGDATIGTGNSNTITINAIKAPEYEPMSGNVVYIENLSPVNRNLSQTEDVKLVLEL